MSTEYLWNPQKLHVRDSDNPRNKTLQLRIGSLFTMKL